MHLYWYQVLLLRTDATPSTLGNRYYPPEFWDQKGFSDKSNLNTFRGESWRNRGAQAKLRRSIHDELSKNIFRLACRPAFC